MSEDNWTTLSLREETKEALRECKIHPNQSFDEILRTILEVEEDD